MPLQKQILSQLLKQGIQQLSQDSKAGLGDVKRVWNTAYRTYALSALPVGGQPVAVFVPTVGPADSLSGGMSSFVSDLASGLQEFWLSGQWAPDLAFKYQTVKATGFVSPHMALQSKDLDSAIDGIVDDLHTYTTTMVQLTATSLLSGATATVLVI